MDIDHSFSFLIVVYIPNELKRKLNLDQNVLTFIIVERGRYAILLTEFNHNTKIKAAIRYDVDRKRGELKNRTVFFGSVSKWKDDCS